VLSYQIVEAEGEGLLQAVLVDWQPAPVPVSMVYDSQGVLPLKLRAFLDFAGPRLKARLSGMTRSE
jgi:DNA-binding transcriptional LysR family regulator